MITDEVGHTPGPWSLGRDGQSVVASDGKSLAREVGPYSRGGGAPHDERRANALLMASAPDLLEVAKDVCDSYERIESEQEFATVIEQLLQVIARAEGR